MALNASTITGFPAATVPPHTHHPLMANVEKLSVDLAPEMAAELRAAVEAGDYDSVSEMVRDALRDGRLRRRLQTVELDELRRLVQEGIDSGPALDADMAFARLRARFPPSPAT